MNMHNCSVHCDNLTTLEKFNAAIEHINQCSRSLRGADYQLKPFERIAELGRKANETEPCETCGRVKCLNGTCHALAIAGLPPLPGHDYCHGYHSPKDCVYKDGDSPICPMARGENCCRIKNPLV